MASPLAERSVHEDDIAVLDPVMTSAVRMNKLLTFGVG